MDATPEARIAAHPAPGDDPRPGETAAREARMAAEAKVLEELRLDLHDAEVLAANLGRPSMDMQDRTHGAGRPEVDLGKPVGYGGQG